MTLPTLVFQLIAGLSILVVSAQVLLGVTQVLAARWKLSPLFVSLVLVALGTSVPELTVVLSSLASQDPGLALGNLVGSNMANMLLVFGVAVLLDPPKIGTTKTPKNIALLVGITSLFLFVQFSSIPQAIKSLLLLGSATSIIVYQYVLAANGRLHEDRGLWRKLVKSSRVRSKSLIGHWLFAAGGLAIVGLLFGGRLVVTSAQGMSTIMGISTTLLGLTLVSVSTTMPELLTIILAGSKRQHKVVVGTVIGSCIYNLGLFAGLVTYTQTTALISQHGLLFLLLGTLLFSYVVASATGERVRRWKGLVLVAAFFLFSWLLFVTI